MSARADVCLIAEGSYPYITGGVSSWTHQLIRGLPDVRFALVSLVPDLDFAKETRYELPPNVVKRQDIVLFPPEEPAAKPARCSREWTAAVETMHAVRGAKRCPYFAAVERLMREGGYTAAGLLAARATWDLVQAIYTREGRKASFLDYYWTWRAIHAPLFRVMECSLPDAAVYHAVSTGYAGFAGAIARLRTGAGYMLTEHGLYTREREIEIAQADWIYQPPIRGSSFAPRDGFFHDWWRAKYQFLEKLSYQQADRVLTLHGVNARAQIAAGVPPAKLRVVPNGVRVQPFLAARGRDRSRTDHLEVALVGRVVPIKDVLTFLRGVHLARLQAPLSAYVLGPLDEDPAYFEECRALVRLLGLEDVVSFPGKVSVPEWMGRVDLVVSTSISESQPLALLEAMAAGVPIVATNVGACREMLEGREGEDALLGPSGLVVPVVTPAAVAEAIVALSGDPARRAAMGQSGIRRVERFYVEERLLAAYQGLYRELARPLGAAETA